MKASLNRPGVFLVLNILLFAVIAGVDQSLKQWAQGLDYPKEFLGMTLFPYENSGIFGGYLQGTDPWVIRIFFSVLFGFLFLGGFLLIHFLRHKSVPLLKFGILIYLSGVLGNVWDRMSRGSVTDYLVIESLGEHGMALNFADAIVILGFVLIATAIFREGDALWFDQNQRKGYWVDGRFQRSFGLLLTLVGFAHFFVIAVYSFVFLKVFIGGPRDLALLEPERIIQDYLIGLFVLEGSGLLLTFAVSVLFSHRLAGPMIALEQYVKRVLSGESGMRGQKLNLRKSDYLRDRMEAIAKQVETASTGSSADQNPVE